MKRAVQIKRDIAIKDAGYVFFIATGLLCVISFLFLTFVAFARGSLENLELQSAAFYKELESENGQILSDWNNDFPSLREDEKSADN